ncbi:MAG: TlpA family protein disulfide reductase [Eubacterium sp.]|nr:TlpA family protein disulfide reductase [Eubacterium sp.]
MKSKHLKSLIMALILIVILVIAVMVYRSYSTQTASESEVSSSDTTVVTDHYTSSIIKPEEEILATDFSVENADGEATLLSDFSGKPVIINYWASWCGICKTEMSEFQSVYNDYGDDVTFMMINLTDGSRETIDSADDYLVANSLTFPVYYDTQSEAANAYGITSIPQTYFIDSNGYIQGQIMGATTAETLIEGIEMISD